MQWLENIIKDDFVYHCGIAVIIVLVFYSLSGLVKKILHWVGKKIFARTQTVLDDLLLEVVQKNVRALMVVVGLHIASREIRKGLAADHLTGHQMLDYADAILYIAVMIVVVKIIFNLLRVVIDWYLDQMAEGGESHLKMTLGPLTSKIVNILVGMVAVIIILDHFGVNIGSLLVSLGVGSLAVALAAQDTLANMIAGFVILVDRPFGVGHRIELPTGQVGDVYQIGLRSTKIINFDNNLIVMPNAELVKSRIVNYTLPQPALRVLIRFELAHGTDVEKVRSILLALAEQYPDVLRDPAPKVSLTGISESAMQFTFVCRSIEYTKQFDAEVNLREQAYAAFVREGIRFAIPQRIIHMKADA
jgi:MscS family membrane protein